MTSLLDMLKETDLRTDFSGTLARLRHHGCICLIERNYGVKIATIECIKKHLNCFFQSDVWHALSIPLVALKVYPTGAFGKFS
jgi:hypothetical protein